MAQTHTQTDRQTYRQTDGHGDSMTNSGENSSVLVCVSPVNSIDAGILRPSCKQTDGGTEQFIWLTLLKGNRIYTWKIQTDKKLMQIFRG